MLESIMKRVLLLNADYSPLHFITDTRAIVLLYKKKAEQLAKWDDVVKTASSELELPATIRLVDYVSKHWRTPRFKRRALFNRDAWTCQYCGDKLNWNTITIDHVNPRSLGGVTSWTNCVAACSRCNKKKANQTPDAANMHLLKKPTTPQSYHFWNISVDSDEWHSDWVQFFQK